MEHLEKTKKRTSLEKGLLFYDLLLSDRWQSSSSLGLQLGVDSRTVKNYAKTLMAYGWPVKKGNGRSGGYKLDDVDFGSLRFTPRDLFSLAILLAQGCSVLPENEANKLRSKLRALLPEQNREKIDGLQEAIAVQGFAPKDWELVEQIGTCLYDRHYCLVLDYRGRTDPEPRRRRVLPLGIRSQDMSLYLDLFDLEIQKHRGFRFDRIYRSTLIKQAEKYADPPPHLAKTHKWDFGTEVPTKVHLEISESLARWLEEKPEHESQVLNQVNGRHYATYQVTRLELFADWLLSLRGVRIVEPQALRDIVTSRARAWLEDEATLKIPWE